MKRYSELKDINNFEDKINYLRLNDFLGLQKNNNRKIMDKFYNSYEWNKIKKKVITRDRGCDLGDNSRPITKYDKVLVHHINPITSDDVIQKNNKIFDMDNLITTTQYTHNLIHYSTNEANTYKERSKDDTKLW